MEETDKLILNLKLNFSELLTKRINELQNGFEQLLKNKVTTSLSEYLLSSYMQRSKSMVRKMIYLTFLPIALLVFLFTGGTTFSWVLIATGTVIVSIWGMIYSKQYAAKVNGFASYKEGMETYTARRSELIETYIILNDVKFEEAELVVTLWLDGKIPYKVYKNEIFRLDVPQYPIN